MTRILLLAGTAEARALAHRLAAIPGLEVTASLAGVTTRPARYAVNVRTGGFGGAVGLRDWLTRNETDLLLNATHPFATKMEENARQATNECGIRYLRLLRPPWPNRSTWLEAEDTNNAATLIPSGARVLLSGGRKDIGPFIARLDVWFLLRSIEPIPDLPPYIGSLIAPPAQSLVDEIALMQSRRITHLIAKNSGGPTMARLDAADALRLTTVMIARPPTPPGEKVETVDQAVAWVQRHVAIQR